MSCISRLCSFRISVYAEWLERLRAYLFQHKLIAIFFVLLVLGIIGSLEQDVVKARTSDELFLSQISTLFVSTGPTSTHDFLYEFYNDKNSSRRIVKIDLESLYREICSGAVEVRDPADLAYLISQEYDLKYPVVFHSTTLSRTRVLLCLLWLYIKSSCLSPTNKTKSFLAGSVVNLNSFPYHQFEQCLRTTLSQFTPNESVLLKLTTTTVAASYLDYACNDFTLCSVPFLSPANSYDEDGSNLTPLLIPLSRLIDIMQQMHICEIIQIENTSLEELDRLYAQIDSLLNDRSHRSRYIAKHGLVGWREECFRLTWKAALLYAGKLTSWNVIVKRK